MLRIEQLTKKFGSNTAVDAATIEVDRPMMIGIIGRSGAGKSTLLRMLNRLTDHTSGSVTFEGRDVTALRGSDKRAWQADCAMIFQQFNLVPRMDVVSNVLHGTLNRRSTLATMFNLFPTEDIHRAIDILDRLGIADHAPKRAEALSGGQQQRVAIARAIVGERRLVLADEPTGALDTETGEEILRLLRARCDAGAAGVLVTHEARHAAWADRVVFLRDGVVVDESGSAPVDGLLEAGHA